MATEINLAVLVAAGHRMTGLCVGGRSCLGNHGDGL
jgi:hypothetical protein